MSLAVEAQLQAPDPVGRDLILLRTRLYRFTDDLRWYVLAESLEERWLAGQDPRPDTLEVIRGCLTQLRTSSHALPFPEEIPEREGIDIQAGLRARESYTWQNVPLTSPPAMIVLIIGAPRSGTSHLFNLLARTGSFGYLTTASCWAWPVRNLHQPGRRLFTEIGDPVFAVDNKRTRLIPGLVMPGEAEDVWDRAIPVYKHIAGHHYQITAAGAGQCNILDAAARAHLAYFGHSRLLAKSPFNCFRIPQIEQLWRNTVRYIHIVRDQHEAADSIHRNHFEFSLGDRLLDAEHAWALFVETVRRHAPADRTVTVQHAALLADPARVLDRISAALDTANADCR